VLRFDSLSKVLAAGLRIGTVTGPTALIEAIDLHTAAANLQPTGTTQVLANALLQRWGIPGFRAHIAGVAQFYAKRRDVFARAMDQHFGGGNGKQRRKLAEWQVPEAGMFFWFKLLLPPGSNDARVLVAEKAFKAGVLALPGSSFFPNGRATPYCRASFSLLSPEDADEALRRLASVVEAEWDLYETQMA